MARSWSRVARPHRTLKYDRGNLQRGDDVKVLQRAINDRLRARGLGEYAVKVDGKYGKATAVAARKALWALGYYMSAVGVVGYRLPEQAQRAIRLCGRERTKHERKRGKERVAKRNRQSGGASGKPRIVDLNLDCAALWGALGWEDYLTGHHTAGPIDKSLADAIRLCRVYHAAHRAKGWGGSGYHYCIARDGTLILLRPVTQKGAHVGGHNTGNVGVMCHGTTGHKPTAAQAATLRWLIANAHTSALPASHRTDAPLTSARLRGHNSWSGHTWNACPGTHKRMYLTGGRDR